MARNIVGGLQHHMYKSRLQEYTQKSCLQPPVYTIVKEGAEHSPNFRATVLVDGKKYASQGTFQRRKSAEHNAAMIALHSIQKRMNDDGCPINPKSILNEDTTLCKSILNEYALKMHLEHPAYYTVQPQGLIPVFASTLVLNGVNYTGGIGRNKKDAEQLAAREAIFSSLDSADSASATIMSEIIESKYKDVRAASVFLKF
ncbi:double-stranded RNA-binding protein 4-like isoform X2 [Coffea arabica]|uniref:Double-stranded RNA-binding protein 4-like isoform X2 n=1 Tax=Coffea arabica TaxID=13443 RepID=A0A6P6SAP5_COFAR|nr:double-stranded RNA-binding protein 4-like isoform X2 [Coffea arabica]